MGGQLGGWAGQAALLKVISEDAHVLRVDTELSRAEAAATVHRHVVRQPTRQNRLLQLLAVFC